MTKPESVCMKFILPALILFINTSLLAEDYEESSELSPVNVIDDYQARLILARSLTNLNDSREEAIEIYESIVHESQTDKEVIKEYLSLLENTGNHLKIINFVNKQIPDSENEIKSLLLESKISALIASGRIDSAINYIKSSEVRNHIKYTDILLAKLYRSSENHSESIRLYQKVLKQGHQIPLSDLIEGGNYLLSQNEHTLAIKYFQKVLEIEKSNNDALRGLGLTYFYSEKYLKAYEIFEKIEKKSSDREVYFSYLRTLARIYKYEDLTQNLKNIEEKELSNKNLNYDISFIYAEIGIPDKSKLHWEKYQDLNEKKEDIPIDHYLQYVDVLKGFGDFYSAEEILYSLFKYTDLETDYEKVHKALAHLYVSTERYEEAKLHSNTKFDYHHKGIKRILDSESLSWNFSHKSERKIVTEKISNNKHEFNDPRIIKYKSEDLYKQGRFEESIRLLQKLVQKYPNFFPGKLSLAFNLASNEKYDKSIELFDDLLEKYPENRMVVLGRARVLSWSRQFKEAFNAYKSILKIHSCDPVVRRELARVYTWAKEDKKAFLTYMEPEECKLDYMLEELLLKLIDFKDQLNINTEEIFLTYQQNKHEKNPFNAYESIDLDKIEKSLKKDEKYENLINDLDILRVEYKIQKSNWLEKEAKERKLKNRNHQAIRKYKELIDFMPWNQEAYFDLAQLECLTNQINCSKDSYQSLLNIDPSHNFARKLLNHKRNNTEVIFENNLRYYSEVGRGELSRINSIENKAGIQVPFNDRFKFKLSGDLYSERPGFNSQTLFASGFSSGFDFALTPLFKFFGEYSFKNYEKDFASTNTGKAGLQYDFYDYAQLELLYNRTNEFYNFFAIDQSVQADRYSAKLNTFFNRKWSAQVRYEYLDYNDSNSAIQADIATSYIFNEHPRTFKVTLAGQHRNTDNDNQFIFDGANLVDLIHPYWAPRNYYLGTVTFEWLHDISKNYFCGSDVNFYNLKLILGDDTDRNRIVRLEALWEYDFIKDYTLNIHGMIHRSREWDSESLTGNIKYRF